MESWSTVACNNHGTSNAKNYHAPCRHVIGDAWIFCSNMLVVPSLSAVPLNMLYGLAVYSSNITLGFLYWRVRKWHKAITVTQITHNEYEQIYKSVRPSSYIQINHPTRCINLSDLLLVVQIQLNMFRASSCPSSGAYKLQ